MDKQIRKLGYTSLLLLTSCAKLCAADQVAQGVARLTTLNADALTNALNADTACGFSSAAVLGAAKFDLAKIGQVSTLTFTVKDCVLDFGTAGKETSKSCQGKATRAFGKATVSGTKVITGYLTGNPLSPIIPSSDTAVEIVLSATFDNFRAEKDEGTASMTWVSGGISGKLKPRLAVAKSTGACAVQTANTDFSDVVYTATKAVLKSDSDEIEVDIGSSNLSGVNGKTELGENKLTGKMNVWEEEFSIPIEGDADGLDPKYKDADFIAGDACKTDIAEPRSYTCDLTPLLGQNAARGLVKLTGAATSLLDANTSCGFKSAGVLSTGTSTGAPGGPGSLQFKTGTTGCVVALPQATELSPDCTGSKSTINGKFTAVSTKTISGLLTGQAANPIVPLTREAVVFEHTSIAFENFEISDKTAAGVAGPKFVFTGTVTGAKVKPVAGEHKTARAPGDKPLYAVATPVAGFEGIALATGTLAVTSGGNTFVIAVKDAAIGAFNGSFNGKSNSISGTVTANGKALAALPDPRLSPDFTQAGFDGTYSCNPDLKEPVPAGAAQ